MSFFSSLCSSLIMTTPDEFLRFAKEMGLGQPSSPSTQTNTNGTMTGLAVLQNLCRLIEQIHQLRTENDRLRAQVVLVNQLEHFHDHGSLKIRQEGRREKNKFILSPTSMPDEDKANALSHSNSLKSKHRFLNRTPKGQFRDFRSGWTTKCSRLAGETIHHLEDGSSMFKLDYEQADLIDSSAGRSHGLGWGVTRALLRCSGSSSLPTWHNWVRVRHALKFSLRRKQPSASSPPLAHPDRQIPTISVSIESDEEHLEEQKRQKKKKKSTITGIDTRRALLADETDLDDESTHFVRAYHQRRLDGNETTNSSSTDRQDTSSSNVPSHALAMDDETTLTRKQSKIGRLKTAHYSLSFRSDSNRCRWRKAELTLLQSLTFQDSCVESRNNHADSVFTSTLSTETSLETGHCEEAIQWAERPIISTPVSSLARINDGWNW